MRFTIFRHFALLAVTVLAGCTGTPTPDYTIRVAPSGDSLVAIPPECPAWATESSNPYDNQPIPQFGCANARNLAVMVDQPWDLIKGRDSGPANAVVTVALCGATTTIRHAG